METPSLSFFPEYYFLNKKKESIFLFSVGAYKIQGTIHRNPNFFGDQGHRKVLQ